MSVRPLHEIAEDLVRMSDDEERHHYAEDFTPLFQELGYAVDREKAMQDALSLLYRACLRVRSEGLVPTMSGSYSIFVRALDRVELFIQRYNPR